MSCIPRVRRICPPVCTVPQWQVDMPCDRCERPHGFVYTGTRMQLDAHLNTYIRCEPCKQLNQGQKP